jgi:hypothetical protein
MLILTKTLQYLLFYGVWWIACVATLFASLFAIPSFTASAQYQWFRQPVWHPSQNMIAVSNGVSVRLYNDDFFSSSTSLS